MGMAYYRYDIRLPDGAAADVILCRLLLREQPGRHPLAAAFGKPFPMDPPARLRGRALARAWLTVKGVKTTDPVVP